MAEKQQHYGLRGLIGLAATIVVIAGLRSAAELLLPILVALFLALLGLPPMRAMTRRRVPEWLAVLIVVLAGTLLVVAVSAIIGQSIAEFQNQLPYYRSRLDTVVSDGAGWLGSFGINIDRNELVKQVDSGAIMQLVGDTATALVSAFSNLLLVLLTMVFMLIEASGFSRKLRFAVSDPNADLRDLRTAADRVSEYMGIKAVISLVTGVLAGLLCYATSIDFPLLWALIAFLFNFVPNIGSIIAAIPAVLLALLDQGIGGGLVVGTGYFAINMVLGNMIEPRVMGQKLGLSTLVVFLSMLFWGWVWGPVGMLLSVPLTVVLKIGLEHTDDYRWLAVLLGPSPPEETSAPAAEPAAKTKAAP